MKKMLVTEAAEALKCGIYYFHNGKMDFQPTWRTFTAKLIDARPKSELDEKTFHLCDELSELIDWSESEWFEGYAQAAYDSGLINLEEKELIANLHSTTKKLIHIEVSTSAVHMDDNVKFHRIHEGGSHILKMCTIGQKIKIRKETPVRYTYAERGKPSRDRLEAGEYEFDGEKLVKA